MLEYQELAGLQPQLTCLLHAQQPSKQPVFKETLPHVFLQWAKQPVHLCHASITCWDVKVLFNARYPRVIYSTAGFCDEESVITVTDNHHCGHTSDLKFLQRESSGTYLSPVRWGPSRKEEKLTMASWRKPHCQLGGQWNKKCLLLHYRWDGIQNFKNINLIKVMIQDI